jgi:hypothetical protein
MTAEPKKCKIPGCENVSQNNPEGLCRHHISLLQRNLIDLKGKRLSKKSLRNTYKECKIEGCNGNPSNQGTFTHGFCRRHYSQYHRGIIDLNGNILREVKCRRSYADHPEISNYNVIVRKAHAFLKMASFLDDAISKIPVNTIKDLSSNDPLIEVLELAKNVSEKRRSLKTKKFIMGNIEDLDNRTIKVLSDYSESPE